MPSRNRAVLSLLACVLGIGAGSFAAVAAPARTDAAPTVANVSPGDAKDPVLVSTVAGKGVPYQRIEYPVMDGRGNWYFYDFHIGTVCKLSPGGEFTMLTGDGYRGYLEGKVSLFWNVSSLAIDRLGNLYLVDGNRIKQVTPQGRITTLAGSTDGYADGSGSAARFHNPYSLVIDAKGNLFVSDVGNSRIRKVTPNGIVSTVAGSGVRGHRDGGRSEAQFEDPYFLAIDRAGGLFVADGRCIRKVLPDGTVSTLAGGDGSQSGHVDGPGPQARFEYCRGLTIDGAGTLFVSDDCKWIRKVSPEGMVSTLLGTGKEAAKGVLVTGAGSLFTDSPFMGVTVDASGDLCFAAVNSVHKVTAEGEVSPVFNPVGNADGVGQAARFNAPTGITVDSAGNLYVSDCWNSLIRKVTPTGGVTTVANLTRVNVRGYTDKIYWVSGIARDASGSIYVADSIGGMILKITPGGEVRLLAGGGHFRADGHYEVQGRSDGRGTAASFNSPQGLALDLRGNVYVADSNNDSIRKIAPDGDVTTVAGGSHGYEDGPALSAKFNHPTGLALAPDGTLYVADRDNGRIRKISPDGMVSTVVGWKSGGLDGRRAEARFAGPFGIALDAHGNLFIAEEGGWRVSQLSPEGTVTTLTGGRGRFHDGPGKEAAFCLPEGIAVDGRGEVFVADTGNNCIRRLHLSHQE